MFDAVAKFIRQVFGTEGCVGLHRPIFSGNEKNYLMNTIDTGFVSSIGGYVSLFEHLLATRLGASHAVATVNGTSALHISLLIGGVKPKDEVITQVMTFVATANAIRYCSASPIFLDICPKSLSLCPQKLEDFLESQTEFGADGYCYNKTTKNRISACIPMHTFGHPAKMDEIAPICEKYNLCLIEDSAESLMSRIGDRYTGTIGKMGVFSFNGNKIITTGGGGAIVTNCDDAAKHAKHLTTTAKVAHAFECHHDQVAYNYRMPNLNAALGLAQLEQIDDFVLKKRKIAEKYRLFFETIPELEFFSERENCISNYWLNAVICSSKDLKDELISHLNNEGILARPVWKLLNTLPMYLDSQTGNLDNALDLENRIVNIPSSVVGDEK